MRHHVRSLMFLVLFWMILACSLPQRLLSPSQPQQPLSSSTLTSLPSLSPTIFIPLPSETPQPASVLDWQLIQGERGADQPDLNFEMTVLYPYLEGSEHDYVSWFNDLIEEFVQTEITAMGGWGEDAAPPDGVSMFSEVYFSLPSSLNWDSDQDFGEFLAESGRLDSGQVVMSAGHDVLSVLFVNFFYLGGAHPGSYYWSLNFDFTTGQELGLGDLFVPGSDYLDRIAVYCIEQLNEKLDFDIWEEGAAPVVDNYLDWTLSPQGLMIIFDEYQVAPYAAGPQQVIVPYAILADIIHPQGPIGHISEGE